MFERFTDRARRVVVLAQELASTLPQFGFVHGTYTTIVSATQAGLSPPSISTVHR